MTLAQLIAWHPEIASLGQNYPAIAAALNATAQVANPVAKAEQVKKRLTLNDVFGAVATAAPADLAKSKDIPDWMIDRAELAMNINDRTAMANWLVSIVAAAGLSDASKTALVALLALTEDDPTWKATVTGASLAAAAGLGTVTASDVQAADVAGGIWTV